MKKIFIIYLLIIFSLFLFGCQKKPPEITSQTCLGMGYIAPQDANVLINLTNKLVDITNYCFANQNITPLSHLKYWPDLKENIIIE